ncbi:hypothetical protein AgCh_007999 [Apium graveolens]
MSVKDAIMDTDIVAGTLIVNYLCAKVLVDSRTTRSFISQDFVNKLNCSFELLNEIMTLELENQDSGFVNQVCTDCEIEISGNKFGVDLIPCLCNLSKIMMEYILGSDNGGVHFTFLEGSDNVGNQFSFLEDDDNVDAAITPSTSSKGWLSVCIEGFNDHRKRMIKKGLRSIYKCTETQKVKVLMIIGRGNYYQEGNIVHTRLKVLDAYTRALGTWARWVDKNIDKEKTQAEKLRSVHREGGVGIAAVHIAKVCGATVIAVARCY